MHVNMCAQVQADNKVEVVLPQRHIQMYGVTHTVYFFPKAFSFCHPYQIYICSCGRKILFKVTCNAFKLYMLLEHVFLGNWNSDLGIAEGSMLYRLSYSSTYQLSANLHKANGVGMDICLMALEITSHLSNLYYKCSNLCLITNQRVSTVCVTISANTIKHNVHIMLFSSEDHEKW